MNEIDGDLQTITVGTSFGCAGQPATAWQSEAAAPEPREPYGLPPALCGCMSSCGL